MIGSVHARPAATGIACALQVHRMRMFAGQMMGAPTEQVVAAELEGLTTGAPRKSVVEEAPAPVSWRERLANCCRRKKRESSECRHDKLRHREPPASFPFLVFVRMAKKAEKARQKLGSKDPSVSVDRIDQISKVADMVSPPCYSTARMLLR